MVKIIIDGEGETYNGGIIEGNLDRYQVEMRWLNIIGQLELKPSQEESNEIWLKINLKDTLKLRNARWYGDDKEHPSLGHNMSTMYDKGMTYKIRDGPIKISAQYPTAIVGVNPDPEWRRRANYFYVGDYKNHSAAFEAAQDYLEALQSSEQTVKEGE